MQSTRKDVHQIIQESYTRTQKRSEPTCDKTQKVYHWQQNVSMHSSHWIFCLMEQGREAPQKFKLATAPSLLPQCLSVRDQLISWESCHYTTLVLFLVNKGRLFKGLKFGILRKKAFFQIVYKFISNYTKGVLHASNKYETEPTGNGVFFNILYFTPGKLLRVSSEKLLGFQRWCCNFLITLSSSHTCTNTK